MKKVLSIIMAMLIMLTSLPAITLSASAAEVEEGIILGDNNALTRAEWLHNLVETFGMYVEEMSMPDNYFTDLEESHQYYEDIILAVEFGVVNIPAGEELRPDDPVTRDFAVSTLNFCLGYQLEEGTEYTFTDYELCTDPDSAQVAVNRGWVSLAGTQFRPDLELTDTEITAMMKDAASVLEGQIVDPNYESTYTYADDVIVIPDGTDVAEDENGNIVISNYDETILVGDKFAVYLNGIPSVYSAVDVAYEDNKIIIEPKTVEVDDAFESIDAQGVLDADTMELVPAEGVEASFEEDTSGTSTYAIKKIKKITAKAEVPFGGFKGSISVTIKNPYVDYSITGNRAYVALCGDATITYGISVTSSDAFGGFKGIKLLTVNVAGIGSFDIDVMIDISGSLSGTVKGDLIAGVECSKSDGVRAIKGFVQKESYSTAEASASVSLKASLGVTKMPVIKASVYAEIGMKCNFTQTTYKEGSPKSCGHFQAYMFAKYGASASAKFGIFSVSESIDYNIYDASNSPVRIVHHYEDRVEVAKCTRGNTYPSFFTKGSSRWGGSGWMGANGAYGLNADGTPFKLYDYTLNDNNEATITKYNGNSWSVYIPKEIDGYTVVAIGSNAFQNKDVGYVDIPDTVTSIGNRAFSGCTALSSVNLPHSLIFLGYDSFYDCDSLEKIYIPKSLETANYNSYYSPGITYYTPFRNCDNLKTVEFEKGITSVIDNLFWNCTGLEKIEIPDTVTSIGADAFRNCINLKEVKIPDTVTSIGNRAFSGCTALSSVNLPHSLIFLGYDSFYDCDSLEKINIPKSLETANYDSYYSPGVTYYTPFRNCDNLKTAEFETGVTSVIDNLFWNCTGLEKIEIPDTVTNIGDDAFRGCTNLKEVKIPDTVTNIGNRAFSGCTALSSINLPPSLISLGYDSFYNCDSLEKINIPKSLETANYDSYYSPGVTYYTPFRNCDNLKTAEFETGVTSVIENLFWNCTGLERIEIPDTVTNIGDDAFRGCTNLKEVKIPDTVTSIGDRAFSGCSAIETVKLPCDIHTIPEQLFAYCTSLKSIEIPDSVTGMGNYVFDGCTSLESAKLPKDITSIPSYTFRNCASLKTIDISSKVKTINGSAFYGCNSLESFSFPNGSSLKEINGSAFYGCSSLKEAEIPFGVETIGNYAFQNCLGFEKVSIPRTVKTINSQAFMGCETLKEVNIADYSITEIKSDTFKDCPSIEKIVLPKGLTKIGSQAFMNCTSLVEVTIPESVTSIDTNALSYPDKTTIRGKKGSYAETFANENGFKFMDYSIPAEGIILKGDDDDHIDIELGETFYAEFEFYPEDANDVVTLKADNSNVTIKGHDIVGYRSGDTTITATTTSGMEYEFTVHIRSVKEIRIITNPTKTTYLMGESFDPTGMEVQAVYSDGFSRIATEWTVSGFDSSKEGQNTITVKWVAPSGSSYTKTLTLTIVDPAPKLTGIFIETEPTKTAYELREKLDLTGMVVMGTYTDGSKKEITGYTTSGYNALKKGKHTITVSYEGFTDTFTITVGETPTEPPKPQIIIGDVDGDGRVTIIDATFIQRHIAQLAIIDEDRLDCADTDKDGRITIIDATMIQRFIAQLIPSL